MPRLYKALYIIVVLAAMSGCGKKATPPGDRALKGELPPRMVFFRLIDDHHIQIEFDRTLASEPLRNTDNFTLTARSGDDAEVVLARLDPATGRQLILGVTGLTPGGTYTLRARNLRSGEGRPLDPLEREFIANAPPDELPPRAIITSPVESSSDQPAIYAQFSEAVRLGPEVTATLAEVLPGGEPEVQPDGDAPPIEEVAPPEEKAEFGPAMDLEPRVVGNRVFLGLTESLAPGKRYKVTLDGVLDLAGNTTEDPEVWRFSVADPDEGYTIEGTVSNADGTALPPDLVLTVSKDPDGELPLAYPLLHEGAFEVRGLAVTNAGSSPYLIARSEIGGWRYEGFFDEDSDGDADRLGAADAGELRVIGLTLRRRDIQGPDLGLEVLEPATGATTVVIAEVVDDAGVELVEAFLDSPGNDGTGAPFTVPPWMNLPGDRRLAACLALNTADWEPGETHQLHVHAKDTGGVWGGMAVLELTKGSEGPVLTGKAVYGGEPVEGVFVALVADPPATPLAFDATDEYGRFTLPRCERGEAIILWKREGETLLVARDSVADVAEETLILELEPWPFFTEVAASLIRFDPASGLTLPADHLLLEARLKVPVIEGRLWSYELELGGERFRVGPPLSGGITAYLDLVGVTLPVDRPPRLLVTPLDPDTGEPIAEPFPWRSSALDLAELPFTEVGAVDEGTEIRLSWEPLYGIAGFYVGIIPEKDFDAGELPDAGVWRSHPGLIRTGELVIPEGDISEYWGVPGGTRYVVAVCAVWADMGDQSWSFGELVHP